MTPGVVILELNNDRIPPKLPCYSEPERKAHSVHSECYLDLSVESLLRKNDLRTRISHKARLIMNFRKDFS